MATQRERDLAKMRPCPVCGRAIYPSSGTCRTCSAALRRATNPKNWCPTCAGPKDQAAAQCRQCRDRAQRIRPDSSPRRVARRRREKAATGLSKGERSSLLAKWRRMGAVCAYCATGAAETIDHVVPLVRGGSNTEGNLLPACKRCNSSKGARLIIEWRAGTTSPRKARASLITPPVATLDVAVAPATLCASCGAPFGGEPWMRYCEAHRKYQPKARRNYQPRSHSVTCDECAAVFETKGPARFCPPCRARRRVGRVA